VLAKGKEFLPQYAMSPHIKILGAKTNRALFYADITTRNWKPTDIWYDRMWDTSIRNKHKYHKWDMSPPTHKWG
jgi:hypothetical protein